MTSREEEDLALAIALSESLSVSSRGNDRNWSQSKDTIDIDVSDEQSLAFFTDMPMDTLDSRQPELSHFLRNDFSRQTQGDFDLARKLQDEEEVARKENQKLMAERVLKDEELAKSLTNEMSNSFHPQPSPYSQAPPAKSSSLCTHCNKTLSGRYLTVEGLFSFHPRCFLCSGCNQPIENTYAKNGSSPNVEFYHPSCHSELYSPKCDICGLKLQKQYKVHGFFSDKQKFCPSHELQRNIRKCCACQLMEPTAKDKEKFSTLPDGRAICPDCVAYIILESQDARELYLEAVLFIEQTLQLEIPPHMRSVPVLAVDLPSLNDQSAINSDICHTHLPVENAEGDRDEQDIQSHSSAVTRGLTISSTSSVRHFSPGAFSWSALTNSWQQNKAPVLMPLQHHTSVTAVLVLCGLPRPLSASILAHEAMHVWLRLNPELQRKGLLSLEPVVEEGLCQLISHLYLQHQVKESVLPEAKDESHWISLLRSYFLYQIETDPSHVYGEGFRKAARLHAELGLKVLIDYIIGTGHFPNTLD